LTNYISIITNIISIKLTLYLDLKGVTVQVKNDIISALQSDILRLQGYKSVNSPAVDLGLGSIAEAFPNGTFPLGAVHEFISGMKEDMAATSGFIAGLLASLMGSNGISLWISASRTVFPPALKSFGIHPERFIFIDLKKEKDVLWVMDEALKCGALTSVVGEMRDISFTESRRLQLAVEQSQVTGFVLRNTGRSISDHPTACVSRWNITPLPAEPIEDLPGMGYPKWRVELSKIRNGKTGVWDIIWMNGKFVSVDKNPGRLTLPVAEERERKVG
jgi:protein ImuA